MAEGSIQLEKAPVGLLITFFEKILICTRGGSHRLID